MDYQTTINVQIGLIVRWRRKDLGYTLEGLSRMAGIPVGSLESCESGNGVAAADLLPLAELLDIEIAEIFSCSPPMSEVH